MIVLSSESNELCRKRHFINSTVERHLRVRSVKN
jgi:hypothetical protein